MYTYVYTCIYLHVYIYVRIYMHICIRIHTHIYSYNNTMPHSTVRSRKHEVQNIHWNGNRNPARWSHVSFQTAHFKRNINFDHSRFHFEFRWPFRVSSLRNRAGIITNSLCTAGIIMNSFFKAVFFMKSLLKVIMNSLFKAVIIIESTFQGCTHHKFTFWSNHKLCFQPETKQMVCD